MIAVLRGSLLVIVLLAVFFSYYAILKFVYHDAERTGRSGALWFIIVLFSHILGLGLYFMTRRFFNKDSSEE